jgi:hypothetical protein
MLIRHSLFPGNNFHDFAGQKTSGSGSWRNRFLANPCIRAHITSRRRAPGWGAVFDPRQDIAPTPGTSLSRTQNSEGLTEGDEVSFEIEDIMRGSQTSR